MGNVSSSTNPHSRGRSIKENAEKSDDALYPLSSQSLASLEKTIFFNDDKKTEDAYAPSKPISSQDGAALAYQVFLKAFPEYQLTWILDTLRQTDFQRLDETGETYMDYMGGSIYPESLLRAHMSFLNANVLGNTHSVSNSSRLSSICAEEARAAVLTYFQAPPDYTVIFTANATGALKLVGESFPFDDKSSFVLGVDSHNSVHGIREFASRRGARVCYIPSTSRGGIVFKTAMKVLSENKPEPDDTSSCLFALTGLSNVTNTKSPMTILRHAKSLGYYTLLDAAALAPTSSFSLSGTSIDAMAISFYKMFGYPTGIGALIAKKSFLEKLQRPWFAGGTVDVVQVPGTSVTFSPQLHEQFEDGTINYLNLRAVTDGLRFLATCLPFLPLRLSCLMHFISASLSGLRHKSTNTPVVKILSRLPTQRVKSLGEKSDTGFTLSLHFLFPSKEAMPNSFIEYAATRHSISLRTGCMCNSGGVAALLGAEDMMQELTPGVTHKAFEEQVGREFGVVRISLGLASSFQDAWRILQFALIIGDETHRESLWNDWQKQSREPCPVGVMYH